jgi:hypothetical protein
MAGLALTMRSKVKIMAAGLTWIRCRLFTSSKERIMDELEYSMWMMKETAGMAVQAVAIYAAALGSYWSLVG